MKAREGDMVCSRRAAFRLPVQEVTAMLGALRGKPPARLAELPSLPDEELATIRPVLNRQYSIAIEDGWVCARVRRAQTAERQVEPIRLFAQERENLLAYNLWNGEHDLGETADVLAAALGWPRQQAFAHVRQLFLSLACRLIMLPKNPPATEA